MYSIDPKTNNITLVRGDYFACSISMTKDDVPFVPTDGAPLRGQEEVYG